MSASSAPPNPGSSQQKPMGRPPPTMLRRYSGPLLLTSIAVGTAFAYYATRPPKAPGTPSMNPMRTPGVRNIEKAYTNGGATATHTPAYGGSVLGSASRRDQNAGLREGAATGDQMKKNFESEGMGDDQRPQNPNAIKGAWNSMKHGSDKGK